MAIKIRINKNHDALLTACVERDLDAAKWLIDGGLNLGEVWTTDSYPLDAALERNDVAMVRLLAEHGMPLHLNHRSVYRRADNEDEVKSMLIFGCWREYNEDACLALLDYATQVNAPDAHFNGLASLAYLKDEFTSEKSDEYLRRLLAMGADVDYPMDRGGTILHSIAEGENSKYVDQLIRLSKNIDAGDKEGAFGTPLYRQIASGLEVATKALLEMGADPNKYQRSMRMSVLDILYYYKQEEPYLNRNGSLDRKIALLQSYGAKTYQQLADDGLAKP